MNHLQGILTTQDIKRILTQPQTEPETLTVGKVCTADVLYSFADESLAEALKRMATRDLRQLPVVDRHLPQRVIGLIDRQVITTAYNTALTKQAITERMAARKLVVVPPAIASPAPSGSATVSTTNNNHGNNNNGSEDAIEPPADPKASGLVNTVSDASNGSTPHSNKDTNAVDNDLPEMEVTAGVSN